MVQETAGVEVERRLAQAREFFRRPNNAMKFQLGYLQDFQKDISIKGIPSTHLGDMLMETYFCTETVQFGKQDLIYRF